MGTTCVLGWSQSSMTSNGLLRLHLDRTDLSHPLLFGWDVIWAAYYLAWTTEICPTHIVTECTTDEGHFWCFRNYSTMETHWAWSNVVGPNVHVSTIPRVGSKPLTQVVSVQLNSSRPLSPYKLGAVHVHELTNELGSIWPYFLSISLHFFY